MIEPEDSPFLNENEPLDVLKNQNIDTSNFNESFLKSLNKEKSSLKNFTRTDIDGNSIWNTVSIFDFINKNELENLSKGLEQVNVLLNNIEGVLETTENVIEIIKIIEGAVKDLLGTILNQIIKILKNFIQNFKYSGVYTLNLIDPFFIDYSKKETRPYWKEEVEDYINNLKAIDKDNYNKNLLNSLESELGPFTETEKQNILNDLEQIETEIFGKVLKTVTYDEFMEKIGDAYINNYDEAISKKEIDELQIKIKEKEEILKYINELFKDKTISYNDKETLETDYKKLISSYEKETMNVGSPKWGPGSLSYNVVLVFNFVDVVKLILTVRNITRDLEKGLETFFDLLKIPYKKSEKTKDENFFEDESLSKSEKQYVEEANIKSYSIQYPPTTDVPRWQGRSLQQLFPGIFIAPENLLLSLESFVIKTEDSWSDWFERALNYIRIRINKIRRILNEIKSFIRILETLKNISLNMLIVESREGVFDIRNKMLGATGFPGQDSGDPQVMLGVVLAAGIPSPDLKDNLLSYPDFLNSINITINEATGEISSLSSSEDEGGLKGLKKLADLFKRK